MSCNNTTDRHEPEPCCPSKFCDDRLAGLPVKTRLSLIGVEGRCLVRSNPAKVGIFQQDGKGGGGFITAQPRLPMPIKRSVLVDSTGHAIPSADGDYEEDMPPPMDFLIGAECDGLQFRMKGQKGKRQNLIWTGCNYVHEDAPIDNTLDAYQYVGPDFGYCNVYEVVLVQQPDGSVLQGYRLKPSTPVGAMMMWGGDSASMPKGWIACEGQELETDLYPDLFNVWGYKWGGGAGLFRAPDGRGRFFRGVNNGAGVDPDAASRTALYSGGNTGDAVGSYQPDSFGGTGKKFENDAANDTNFANEVRPLNIAVFLMAFAGCIIEE